MNSVIYICVFRALPTIFVYQKNIYIKNWKQNITTKPSLCKDNQILNTIFEITIHPEGP